jgi:uncharacterized membrane protein
MWVVLTVLAERMVALVDVVCISHTVLFWCIVILLILWLLGVSSYGLMVKTSTPSSLFNLELLLYM